MYLNKTGSPDIFQNVLNGTLEAIRHEKWRCRFAAGGGLRRQAFFQCFKRCLKLYMRKASTCKNGVAALRQEAAYADRHFPMLQTLFEAIYAEGFHMQKWRCRSAAGGGLHRQAFFQCFKLCLKLLYHKSILPQSTGVLSAAPI
ncbi:MAG: hypothetical protein KH284_08525 [Clostridiales bacterium]|nr:hypothetical protein [Clostridiales bacterium]